MRDFSNGHPGGVRTLLDVLIHSPNLRQHQKNPLIITLKVVLGALDDDAFFTSQLAHGPQGFKRGLPTREVLQDRCDIARIFEDLLVFDYLDGGPTASEALNCCHKMGWVHAEMLSEERQVYVLPTKKHKRFLQILLRKELPDFPDTRFAQIEDLCFKAITKFSVLSLRPYNFCLGARASVQPVEAQYQKMSSTELVVLH
ncbi:hypothetical protein MMC31_005984 [Peltigera leucophlebia]|nr:hypothetical protein [Peltigera leucophlebia]